jgi:hypothetical protein
MQFIEADPSIPDATGCPIRAEPAHFRSAAWEIGGVPQQTLVFRRISAIVDKTETAGFPCPKYTTF